MAKKILIVDDEPQLVDMLKMRLEANDYEVIIAYDGREGLEKAKKEKPALIVLDILMPKMEGNLMAAALKTDDKTYDIPIIFLTCLAEGVAEDQKEFMSGGNLFLAKPFDAAELLSMVDKVIRSSEKK